MAPIIRLTPLPFSALPSHPDLDATNATTTEDGATITTSATSAIRRPSLHDFLYTALTEAQAFLTSTLPQRFQEDKKTRESKPSTAKVHLLTGKDIQSGQQLEGNGGEGEGNGEFWVCRKSIHDDVAKRGTATWQEFESGLRVNHSDNEMAYTPSVKAVEHLLKWDVVDEVEGGWKDVDLHANMITHTFTPGALIKPRTFITLVITARLPISGSPPEPDQGLDRGGGTHNHHQQQQEEEKTRRGFATIQIPLLNPANPAHKTPNSNRANLQTTQDSVSPALLSRIINSAPKDAIFAHYASIERVIPLSLSRSQDQGQGKGHGKIEWLMATTSNAGGSIPEWVQRSWTMGGIPKAIVKDVGLFLDWIDKNRMSENYNKR